MQTAHKNTDNAQEGAARRRRQPEDTRFPTLFCPVCILSGKLPVAAAPKDILVGFGCAPSFRSFSAPSQWIAALWICEGCSMVYGQQIEWLQVATF